MRHSPNGKGYKTTSKLDVIVGGDGHTQLTGEDKEAILPQEHPPLLPPRRGVGVVGEAPMHEGAP